MNNLNEHIENTWRQLKEASKNENWATVQVAFRRMATLQDLNEQSRLLTQRIEGLSEERLPDSNTIAGHRTESSSNGYADGRRRGTIRPKELRIGNHQIPIAMSNRIVIETANWILKQGKALPRIENFVHPSNTGFARSAQTRRLEDGSYIEIGDQQEVLIQKARRLLNTCGFRDLKLEVFLEDGSSKNG
jgi:hypothetical protein